MALQCCRCFSLEQTEHDSNPGLADLFPNTALLLLSEHAPSLAVEVSETADVVDLSLTLQVMIL